MSWAMSFNRKDRHLFDQILFRPMGLGRMCVGGADLGPPAAKGEAGEK